MENSILNLGRIKHFLTNNSVTRQDATTQEEYIEHTPVKYRWSHGCTDEYLGDGILIYSLIMFYKAKTCVCLGSGGGFIPRIMTQARLDLFNTGIFEGDSSMEWGDIGTTILVDAMNGVNGHTDYEEKDSFFRHYFTPFLIKDSTENAYYNYFIKEDIKVDYLHIDADHSYEGVKKDFELYSKIMSPFGIISIHDTDEKYLKEHILHEGGHPSTGASKLVKELEEGKKWEIFNFFNYGIMRDKPASTGLTILRKK